jgi:hypothetical protein
VPNFSASSVFPRLSNLVLTSSTRSVNLLKLPSTKSKRPEVKLFIKVVKVVLVILDKV